MDTNLLDQTRSHYDSFPFIEGGANRIAWWREYLRAFLPDRQIQDRLVLDVGSSVGEISRGMIDRGARLICLDLSFESLRRCRRVNPEAELLHASALDLPFPNNTFDHSIAIGVLHHTPDCRRRFREMARAVAPGGTILRVSIQCVEHLQSDLPRFQAHPTNPTSFSNPVLGIVDAAAFRVAPP